LIQGSPSTWLVRFRPEVAPKLRLVCFPHAGVGAAVYRPWKESLPPGVEGLAVQLPGRENRLREPALRRLTEVVRGVSRALDELSPDVPTAFFGHSMGALIAYTTACHRLRAGRSTPVHLFVSGKLAPHRGDPRPSIHSLSDSAFVEQVQVRWNGIPAAVLEARELLELMLPTLRADITVVETRELSDEVLECPISCFGGIDDPSTSREDLEAWKVHTRDAFSLRMFEGNHFFVQTSRKQVLAAVGEDLQPVLDRIERASRQR
jgi:medium-chain acyl-[acyl-carrier-protein] hydrolase